LHELTFDECRDSLRLCLRPCHQPEAEDDDPEPTQKSERIKHIMDYESFKVQKGDAEPYGPAERLSRRI